MCLCVCPSFRLFVCVHDNAKNNSLMHLKIERLVVFENNSDEFEIGIV